MRGVYRRAVEQALSLQRRLSSRRVVPDLRDMPARKRRHLTQGDVRVHLNAYADRKIGATAEVSEDSSAKRHHHIDVPRKIEPLNVQLGF